MNCQELLINPYHLKEGVGFGDSLLIFLFWVQFWLSDTCGLLAFYGECMKGIIQKRERRHISDALFMENA